MAFPCETSVSMKDRKLEVNQAIAPYKISIYLYVAESIYSRQRLIKPS
jgi:hypothetical protein